MPGEVLLDTNVVIGLFKGQQTIVNRLTAAIGIYVSAVSVGELIYGALKSTHQAESATNRRLRERVVVLPYRTETARAYAGIKHELQQKGQPIPDNDLWIAALSIQHDLLLLTLDKHFAEISRLSVELCG